MVVDFDSIVVLDRPITSNIPLCEAVSASDCSPFSSSSLKIAALTVLIALSRVGSGIDFADRAFAIEELIRQLDGQN